MEIWKRGNVTLICGDCLEVLPTLEADSIDTGISDPPYGLKFMGREWDHGVPGVPFWKEVLRVLKPGASLLAFGGTRTYHRLASAIEDSGFELRDCLCWLHGMGLPKGQNISKAIDKELGNERKKLGVSSVIAGRKNPSSQDDGSEGSKRIFRNSEKVINYHTAPGCSESALWDGWHTALKPAFEPILLAMKPLDGSFVENGRRWGVAGLNIDGCRLEGQAESFVDERDQKSNQVYGGGWRPLDYDGSKGRFPANVVIDEVAAQLIDEQAPKVGGGRSVRPPPGKIYGNGKGYNASQGGESFGYGDNGGASRFFYCAKASGRERNAGCENLPPKNLAGTNKWTDVDYRRGDGEITAKPQGNHHPCVKPKALMAWLARLTSTPTKGIVLDPFMGSGSTALGAIAEGRGFIGIEKDPEYFEIAKARCVPLLN